MEEQTIIEGFTFPECFKNVLEDVKNFEVYDDDIWVCSFPKSGTTWSQEMIWMIMNDLDFEGAKVVNEIRMPYLEFSGMLPSGIEKMVEIEHDFIYKSIEFAKNAKRPRIMKTHLPFVLLPKQIQTFERTPKIIYVFRNFKDNCVSQYHHYKNFVNYTKDFDHFWKEFLEGKMVYGPMIESVKSYWKYKSNPNFYFLRYEDMKRDLRSAILNVSKFLNKTLSDEDISKLMDHISFESMKKNPYVDKHEVFNFCKSVGVKIEEGGQFFRKGEVGAYAKEITPEIEKEIDEYLKKELVDTDLQL